MHTHLLVINYNIKLKLFNLSCTSCDFYQVQLGSKELGVSLAFQDKGDRMVNKVSLGLQVGQGRKVSLFQKNIYLLQIQPEILLCLLHMLFSCKTSLCWQPNIQKQARFLIKYPAKILNSRSL